MPGGVYHVQGIVAIGQTTMPPVTVRCHGGEKRGPSKQQEEREQCIE